MMTISDVDALQGADPSASRLTSERRLTAPSNNSPAAIKLRKAAAEFESTLISSLWKSMKSTFADPDQDDATDPSHDVLGDWGIRAMSNAIANAGGLGIGRLILKDLEPKLTAPNHEN